MSKRWDYIFGASGAVAIYAAFQMLPWPWVVGGLGAVVLVGVAVIVVPTAWNLKRLRALPPAPPMACPTCGATEHEHKSAGLWDGMCDPATGGRPGGIYAYGICKACGSRWAKWDDDPAYVPADEEWEREIAGPEAARAAQLRQWTQHHADNREWADPASR